MNALDGAMTVLLTVLDAAVAVLMKCADAGGPVVGFANVRAATALTSLSLEMNLLVHNICYGEFPKTGLRFCMILDILCIWYVGL